MSSSTIEIAQASEEAFAFVTDPAKPSAWQVAEEVQRLTEGPGRAGTRFRDVHEVMGRRRVALTEVVECEPGRLFQQVIALGFRRFRRRLKRALEQDARSRFTPPREQIYLVITTRDR